MTREDQMKEIRSVDLQMIQEFREYVRNGADIVQGSKWMEFIPGQTRRSWTVLLSL